jgi:hypothetical protein
MVWYFRVVIMVWYFFLFITSTITIQLSVLV